MDLDHQGRRSPVAGRRLKEPALDAPTIRLMPASHRGNWQDLRPGIDHQGRDRPGTGGRPAAVGWSRDIDDRHVPGSAAIADHRRDTESRALRHAMGSGDGVFAVRQPVDPAICTMRPPQLVGAIDGRCEDEPGAVSAPRDPWIGDAREVRVDAGTELLATGSGQVDARLPSLRQEQPKAIGRRVASRESVTGRRDAVTLGAPRRLTKGSVAATPGHACDRSTFRIDEIHVGTPRQVRRRVPVRHERDPAAIGAPRGLAITRGAGCQAPGSAVRDIDQPQVRRSLIGKTDAVELILQPVDKPKITCGRQARIAAPADRLRTGRRRHDAQPSAVGAPRELTNVIRQSRQLACLAPSHRQQPDLGGAPVLVAGVRVGRPVARTTCAQHPRPVAQEGEARAVRAPARRGVMAGAQRQLPGGFGAIRGHQPDGHPIAVPPRRGFLDHVRNAGSVGGEPDLDGHLERVQVFGTRRTWHQEPHGCSRSRDRAAGYVCQVHRSPESRPGSGSHARRRMRQSG